MKKGFFILTGCVIFMVLMLVQCSGRSKHMRNGVIMDLSTVQNVDIERYLGVWYEITRFPHRFERGLVGVTATYSRRNDRIINVVNQGFQDTLDGRLRRVRGRAKLPNPAEPGKLKVAFFLWFYADYYILELDTEDYQWALVGSSSPNFLWILSRTPHMKPEVYEMLVARAQQRGYDISRLELVEQAEAR